MVTHTHAAEKGLRERETGTEVKELEQQEQGTGDRCYAFQSCCVS